MTPENPEIRLSLHCEAQVRALQAAVMAIIRSSPQREQIRGWLVGLSDKAYSDVMQMEAGGRLTAAEALHWTNSMDDILGMLLVACGDPPATAETDS